MVLTEMMGRPRLARRVARVREHQIALLALGAYVALVFAAALIPQRSSAPPVEYAHWRVAHAPVSGWLEMLGLTAVASSAWLPLVTVLLGASMARCTARRALGLVVAWHRHGVRAVAPPRVGSVVFHAALLAALTLFTLSALTRSTSHAELAPGAALVDAPDGYLSTDAGPWAPGPTGLVLRLDDLRLAAWPDGSLREQRATFSALAAQRPVARGELARSGVLDLDSGLSVLLGARTGPAALFAVGGSVGIRTGWVHFSDWPPDQATPTEETSFVLPANGPVAPLRLHTTVTAVRPGDADSGVVALRLASGGPAWRLRPGEEATIEGVGVRLVALDGWTSVTVMRDPFAAWAFGASAAALLGLAAALGPPLRWPRREAAGLRLTYEKAIVAAPQKRPPTTGQLQEVDA